MHAAAPTAPRADSRFWDRIARRYAAKPVADPEAYAEKLRMTQAALRPDWDALEIGCGTGTTALAHAPHLRSLRATDISPRMIEIARDRAAEVGATNVTLEVAALDEVAAPAGGYDAVLALSLLHLMEDLDAALARIDGLLRPGGLFVSSTACLGDGMGWFRFVAPLARRLGLIPHVAVFGEARLTAAMAARGFVIERRFKPGAKAAVFLMARKPA